MKCQPWCLAGSVSEGRRELAALALHRMSEALRNSCSPDPPPAWNPHPALFWVWPAWRGALLCYSSQDNKPTKSQRAPDCGIPMLDGAGVVSVGARNTDPEGYEAPGKTAWFQSVFSVAVPAICVGSWH